MNCGLLTIWEAYALIAHWLRCNAKKLSSWCLRQALSAIHVPSVNLCGIPLSPVKQFKYLDYWVIEDLSYAVDIVRKRRAISVRYNMLARTFARCNYVKVTLYIRAPCGSIIHIVHVGRYVSITIKHSECYSSYLPSTSGLFTRARLKECCTITRYRLILRLIAHQHQQYSRVLASR